VCVGGVCVGVFVLSCVSGAPLDIIYGLSYWCVFYFGVCGWCVCVFVLSCVSGAPLDMMYGLSLWCVF